MMVGIPIYAPEPPSTTTSSRPRCLRRDYPRHPEPRPLGQRIEIRVVVHRHTVRYSLEIAEFIARNLPFVDQVALMGLEMTGFARANLDEVWIDPADYQPNSLKPRTLTAPASPPMIYNHQLCVLDETYGLSPFAQSATGRTNT